jgi:ribosomal protein S18 acetylase RimI-like enzyme
MPSSVQKRLQIRTARVQDLPDLLTLEQRAFESDRVSRRSFRRFLNGSDAALLVASRGKDFAGYALVLFRPRCPIARLYSIAVSQPASGGQVSTALIDAAAKVARKRRCKVMRFDVQEKNAAAISRCRKSGFCEMENETAKLVGRPRLHFEKPLYSEARA